MLHDALVARIEAGDPDVSLEITAPMRVQFDARNRSPFDIALTSDRRDIIAALAAHKAMHGVAAQPRDDLKPCEKTIRLLRTPLAVRGKARYAKSAVTSSPNSLEFSYRALPRTPSDALATASEFFHTL